MAGVRAETTGVRAGMAEGLGGGLRGRTGKGGVPEAPHYLQDDSL